MSGYCDDYSRSIRAKIAEKNGLRPLSRLGLGLNKKDMSDLEIEPAEWHHTSLYYNETDYYDPEHVLETLTCEPHRLSRLRRIPRLLRRALFLYQIKDGISDASPITDEIRSISNKLQELEELVALALEPSRIAKAKKQEEESLAMRRAHIKTQLLKIGEESTKTEKQISAIKFLKMYADGMPSKKSAQAEKERCGHAWTIATASTILGF